MLDRNDALDSLLNIMSTENNKRIEKNKLIADIICNLGKKNMELESDVNVLLGVCIETACGAYADKRDPDLLRSEIRKKLEHGRNVHLARQKDWIQSVQNALNCA